MFPLNNHIHLAVLKKKITYLHFPLNIENDKNSHNESDFY